MRSGMTSAGIVTYGQFEGFTRYATRTILSGEADELVELAKTNLRDLDIE
jgi:pyruvate dehydrogenase (quinone)